MTRSRPTREALLVATSAGLALSSIACGGAMPLLHPAHVLLQGDVTAGAGVSGQIAAGNTATAITNARQTTVGGLAPIANGDQTYRTGALAIAAVSPGVAPYVSGRVGVGYGSEAGIEYTSRALRVDARHAFESKSVALSVGLGAHGVLGHVNVGPSTDLQGLDTNGVHGWGLDLPVLVGWRSDAELVQAWAGVRAGYEHLSGDIGLGGNVPGGADADCTENAGLGAQICGAAISANRYWGGGLVGLAIGFRHVFVAMELDVSYEHASGTFTSHEPAAMGQLGSASASISGVSIAPAGALIGRF